MDNFRVCQHQCVDERRAVSGGRKTRAFVEIRGDTNDQFARVVVGSDLSAEREGEDGEEERDETER